MSLNLKAMSSMYGEETWLEPGGVPGRAPRRLELSLRSGPGQLRPLASSGKAVLTLERAVISWTGY